MIQVKDNKVYPNGFAGYYKIFSTIGMKILDKRDGEAYDNTYVDPIAVDKIRYDNGDYVETSEPIEPIAVDIREPIKEEEV